MQSPQSPVAPGWYPDPQSPALERWWDGVAWSTDFTRPAAGPAQPHVAGDSGRFAGIGTSGDVSSSVTRQTTPSTGRYPGVPAMLLGALILIARIYWMSAHSQVGSDPATSFLGEYNTMFEMAAGAFVFSWGLSRNLSSRRNLSGEAESDMVHEVLPFTLAVTVLGLLIGSALN